MSEQSIIMKRKPKHNIDMLNGTLWNKILLFALPIAASSTLQQLFNSADIAVIGNFAGSNALAAVGANGALINLLVNLFVGLSVGSNVIISLLLGKNDIEKAKNAVHTSVLLALISGVFLAIVGILFARPILTLISTPDEILDLAALYLKIYFSGMPFIMLYNFEAAILRSKGDTKRPLIALIIAGSINIILNLFLVIVCKMSVKGVAIATVVSNIVSSLMLLYFLTHDDDELRLNLKKLRFHWDVLISIAKIGIPSGLQGMVFSASNLCIQSAINGLGANAVAASAAALNYEYFAYFIINSFGQAGVTFISRNYGAGQKARCRSIVRWCMLLGGVSNIIICGMFILFAHPFISVFTSDPVVENIAMQRMFVVLSFEIVNMVIEILSGCMRGVGCSAVPALICVIGICGVRILWVYTVFRKISTFTCLMLAYPISWLVTATCISIAYFIVRKKVDM